MSKSALAMYVERHQRDTVCLHLCQDSMTGFWLILAPNPFPLCHSPLLITASKRSALRALREKGFSQSEEREYEWVHLKVESASTFPFAPAASVFALAH